MPWRTAGAVVTWHQNLKAGYPYAAPPATVNAAWGTIGDTAHTSTSDHSPKDFPGWGNDIVTAGDAPHVPALGLDMHRVTEAMRLSRDPRIKYVIWNRRMYSSYAANGFPPYTWRPYSNATRDPHTDHAHLSVVGDPRGDDPSLWQIGVPLMDLTVSSGPQAILQGQTNGAVLRAILGLALMTISGGKRDDLVVWKPENELHQKIAEVNTITLTAEQVTNIGNIVGNLLAPLLPTGEDIERIVREEVAAVIRGTKLNPDA